MDATGRPSAGLLFGTTGSYGDYDECLSVRHGSAAGGFAGKYCTLFYSLPAEFVRKTTLHMQKQGYYQVSPALPPPNDTVVPDCPSPAARIHRTEATVFAPYMTTELPEDTPQEC